MFTALKLTTWNSMTFNPHLGIQSQMTSTLYKWDFKRDAIVGHFHINEYQYEQIFSSAGDIYDEHPTQLATD
jgi:hypothetical protein